MHDKKRIYEHSYGGEMADYIAEEHHSGHLLASDLIFPEKIRQWLRDKVDRYGKAQS